MKTSELIGPALDWAVGVAQQWVWEPDTFDGDVWWPVGSVAYIEKYQPSTDWSQGGPLITREGIYLRAIRKEGHPLHGSWLAAPSDSNTGTMIQWVKRADWRNHYVVGPTPLIAAMRCFVESRLGAEIALPEKFR